MLKLESVALELFEYKVEDIRAKRAVAGGVSSVWELYHHLTKEIAVLTADERRRLEAAGRSFRRVSEGPRANRSSHEAFSELVLGDLPDMPILDGNPTATGGSVVGVAPAEVDTDPEVAEEQALLQRLALKVWWHDLERLVQRVAAGLRAERDRYTARLLYATLRNFGRYLEEGHAVGDGNLSRFTVVEAIPERDDPLLSLNDLDSLAELVREAIETIFELTASGGNGTGVKIPEARSLDFLRQIALAVAADPYAGRLTLIPARGPTSGQLRVALQELAREPMRDDQRVLERRELERRLQATLTYERHQRQIFGQDVERFRDLMAAFFGRLEKYLPRRVGGQAGGPSLQGGVLFAVNPALRWESVPPHTTALTVRLRGPTRFALSGIDVAVSLTGAKPSLYVQDKELPLKPRMALRLGRNRVLIFLEGSYLHVKLEDDARSLAVMVAEAVAVSFVLGSEHRDDLLTVLRIVANTVVGEPQELVRLALARLAAASVNAPKRREAIEGFVRGSARAASIALPEGLVMGVVMRFHAAMTVEASELGAVLERIERAESVVLPLTGEPLAIDLAGYSLTVRQYRGRGRDAQENLVVMLPGQTVGSFDEYLIESLGAGTLLCVRGDGEVAVIYIRDAAAELDRGH